MSTIVFAPLVISGIESFNEGLKSFVIQIRKKNTRVIIFEEETGAVKKGLKWRSEPLVFENAVKGTVYQIRSAVRDVSGDLSVYSAWVNETAGDASFGTGHSWTNTITSRSTCIDVAVQLNTPPQDFERIEIYVRDASGTTDHTSWIPDFVMYELSFEYPWVGTRAVTKYFYIKAFDKSGNASAIEYIGSGAIQIILPGDMDSTPPDSSTVTASLDS